MMRFPFRLALIFSLLLTAASCARNPFVVNVSNCPAVAVASNTGNLVRFASEGRNLDDIQFEATITGVDVDCAEGSDIRQEVSFAIVVELAPGRNLDSVTLPYFVVLMRDNNLITHKRIYEATVRFAPGQRRSGVTETIVQTLPDVDLARRYDYELLIGFQLSPDEVAYNMLR